MSMKTTETLQPLEDRISTTLRFEETDTKTARIWMRTFIDGVEYSEVTLCSGPIGPTRDFFLGEITAQELAVRYQFRR